MDCTPQNTRSKHGQACGFTDRILSHSRTPPRVRIVSKKPQAGVFIFFTNRPRNRRPQFAVLLPRLLYPPRLRGRKILLHFVSYKPPQNLPIADSRLHFSAIFDTRLPVPKETAQERDRHPKRADLGVLKICKSNVPLPTANEPSHPVSPKIAHP